MSNDTQPDQIKYPVGRFYRSTTGDEMEVVRPPGLTYPVGVQVRWLTPAPGRDALSELLSSMMVLEIDHFVEAVLEGGSYQIAPLQELAQREGWYYEPDELESDTDEASGKFRLTKLGETRVNLGNRLDLLLALELMLRCALEPFAGEMNVPTWVERSRQVYPQLQATLQGHDFFQPKP
jgi:hypothetical protein